ncbi:MAG: VOC family protein, partial [Mycobacterium sp.]
MGTSVGQYCIYVQDLERAERFYCDAVGLEAQTRTEIPDVHEVVLAAANGGGRLQLAERYQNGS